MKITSKKGFEMDVQVSGFVSEPKITISFSVGGKNIKETAKIVRNEKIVEGLAFVVSSQSARIECPVSEIEKAISELPIRVPKTFIKVEKTSNFEGYESTDKVWRIGNSEMTIPNNSYKVGNDYVYFDRISEMLDKAGIEEIEIEKALAMYAEVQSQKQQSNPKSSGLNSIFNDDLAEEGLDQAMENAGLPKFLKGLGNPSDESPDSSSDQE